jgi:hypothetical protein
MIKESLILLKKLKRKNHEKAKNQIRSHKIKHFQP